MSIFLGNGDGTFGARTDFATGKGPTGTDLGDLDGDTKLDLVVANSGVNTTENVARFQADGQILKRRLCLLH